MTYRFNVAVLADGVIFIELVRKMGVLSIALYKNKGAVLEL